MDAAIKRPLLKTEKSHEKMLKTIHGMVGGDKSAKEEFADLVSKALNPINAVIQLDVENIPQDIIDSADLRLKAMKSSHVAGHFSPVNVAEYNAIVDELAVDMGWMPLFRGVSVTGSQEAEIYDFESFVRWAKYEHGQPLEPSPIGKAKKDRVQEERFGVKVQMFNRWLETNQKHNVNQLFEIIRRKNVELKSAFFYHLIGDSTGLSTQTAAGSTTDDIIDAMNDAHITLLEQIKGKGYDISAQQPVYAVSQLAHRAKINPAIRQQTTAEQNNKILEFPVASAIYTMNDGTGYSDYSGIAKQYGSPLKDSFIMCVAGIRNLNIQFKPITQDQKSDFDTDSSDIAAQEYFSGQAPTEQRIIVNTQS